MYARTSAIEKEHEAVLLMLRIAGEIKRPLIAEGGLQGALWRDSDFLKVFVDKCRPRQEE